MSYRLGPNQAAGSPVVRNPAVASARPGVGCGPAKKLQRALPC